MMTFDECWPIALESAQTAVQQCREINKQIDYGLDEPVIDGETTADDPTVLALAHHFMTMLRQRGLVV